MRNGLTFAALAALVSPLFSYVLPNTVKSLGIAVFEELDMVSASKDNDPAWLEELAEGLIQPNNLDTAPPTWPSISSNSEADAATHPPSTPTDEPSTQSAALPTSQTTSPVVVTNSQTCPSPSPKAAGPYWLDDQDHSQSGAGHAPYIPNSNMYPVYRNVMDYNVNNDGSGDQTAKLQNAIDTDGNGGTRKGNGVTRYPAEIFLPGGVYVLGSTLTLTVGTIIVGDPQNPPIIRASPGFRDQFLVMGYDKNNGNPETSFMTLVKNVIFDTTMVSPDQKITALQWGVAQGSGLTNVQVRMQTHSMHTGIDIVAGSTIAVTDVTIIGGGTGIINSNQQVNFKNIHFISCGTAFEAKGGFTVLLQGATFETCGTGINMTENGLGSLVLLDSESVNSGPVVRFHDSSRDTGNQNSQFIIENLTHDTDNPIAVDSEGTVHLGPMGRVDTWLWGTVSPGTYKTGQSLTTQRPPALLVNGQYFTKAQPTYAQYSGDQIVNIKTVSAFPVKGDGMNDDTHAINAILAQNAASCKITYIPFGVYKVSDTIFIPVGSRLVGEAWPVITGYGDLFKDQINPRAIVKIGNPGDVGTVEIQEMRFSVSEILPGAKIIEINAAGAQPGDVGLWNTLATVGGTAETSISDICISQDAKDCMAAFMVMHLTESSSAYIENFWGWTADHNLDSKTIFTIISTGRGILVESTKGTWLTGTGFEHHWLYQYNFHNAANVFAGLLQTETPYMQGFGEFEKAPAPWIANPSYGDPDFSWCGADDQKCRTALATNIDGGSNIALHNSAAWAFFDGYWNGLYNEACVGKCQSNMMRVSNNPQDLVWYSISTRMTDTMVLDGKSNPKEADHPGGWEAIIQSYQFSP
ncbi:Pectin lyase fold/virulence factor [Penicillium taxi]|uniref:Pectin lyase fold/virulence factor n=1 Tax=Penicillium taxi TaxID=168475 RepID=UPI0025450660|nr:Pectin lyase fold/virulence factor [Penicillium taxi]KAJ5885420.1 Pectin lyase fold/virulence factor [Penicillium taxi]